MNYGAIQSPKDERDYKYSNVKRTVNVKLPSKFVLDTLPVRDQGKAGTCVGFAATVIQEADGMTKKDREVLSPLFHYAKCKAIDGITVEGTTLRASMKALANSGVCNEKLYPYTDSKDIINLKFPTITSNANVNAISRKIIGYSQVNTKRDVKEAVFNENGVIAGIMVTDSFLEPQNGCVGYLNGYIHGYHAIPIIGWDDNKKVSFKYDNNTTKHYTGCFIIKNSWGDTWGDKGIGYIPYDVFDIEEPDEAPYKFKLVEECWTTIHTTLGNGQDDPYYHKRLNGVLDPDPTPDPTPEPTKNLKIAIEMQIDNPVAKLNSKNISMTASPKLINNATMTPFRSPFEMLGGKVSWNQSTKTAKAEFSLEDIVKKFKEIGV